MISSPDDLLDPDGRSRRLAATGRLLAAFPGEVDAIRVELDRAAWLERLAIAEREDLERRRAKARIADAERMRKIIDRALEG